MKRILQLLTTAGICSFIHGCTADEESLISQVSNEESNGKIIISVDEFIQDTGSTGVTRTDCNPSNNYAITWNATDVIGIFPYEGDQEPFEIPADQVGNTSVSFDGGYWALKDGKKYNAYYPFNRENYASAESKTKIPVSYLGQYQNGDDCNIGAFDYTYSDWATSEGGKSVSFKFHHVGSFLVLTLPIPATADYKTLTLSANSAVIPTAGTYDLTAASPSFVATSSSKVSSLSMALNNCSLTAGEDKVFYMMVPPMDLSACDLTVTLSTGTSSCSYYLDSFSVGAGKLKKVTGSPKRSDIDGTYPDWQYLASIVKVNTPGTLSSLLKETVNSNLNEITELRISGNLNSSDIYALQSMENLETLDLNRTNIVVSGRENEWQYDFINANCFKSLKVLSLPKSLTKITWFHPSPKLEVLNIYDNVTSIAGDFSEERIYALKEINVSEGNSTYASYDGVLYTKDYSKLIACPASKTSISFPSGLKTIAANAFYNSSITSIVVPEGVESIGNQAFYHYCYDGREEHSFALKSLSLPSTLVSLGNECFAFNQSLESVSILDGVTTIPASCFRRCSSLTTITIPSSVTSIKEKAFYGCYELSSLYLLSTSNMCSIGREVFLGDTELAAVHVKGYWNANNWQSYEFGQTWFTENGYTKTHILYVPSSLFSTYTNSAANSWGRQFTIQVEE